MYPMHYYCRGSTLNAYSIQSIGIILVSSRDIKNKENPEARRNLFWWITFGIYLNFILAG